MVCYVRNSITCSSRCSTSLLNELEESGFILKYNPLGKKSRNSIYQLVDFYSLFYLKFLKDSQPKDANQWINAIDNPKHRAWSGYAFEQVCLCHLPQIKNALGISGVYSTTSSWRSATIKNGAQIDLVIDRRDHVINPVSYTHLRAHETGRNLVCR